jgi:hypothetical protein
MLNFLKSQLLDEGGELKEIIQIQIDENGVDEVLNQYLPYYLAGMLFDEMPPFKKKQQEQQKITATSMTKKRQHSDIAEDEDKDDDSANMAYSAVKGSVKKWRTRLTKKR